MRSCAHLEKNSANNIYGEKNASKESFREERNKHIDFNTVFLKS
jgi:hypothetical protein